MIGGKGFDKCNEYLVKNQKCKQVECALFRTVVLTDDGKVLTIGKAGKGNPDCGQYEDHILNNVLSLKNLTLKVIQIACGTFHTAALLENNSVKFIGSND